MTKRVVTSNQTIHSSRMYGSCVRRLCFKDNGGYSSIGFAVAILLVFALLFTSVRIYRINSAAADIQYIADSAALAAEDVVCEYLVLARIVDAVIFSLSLAGITIYGIAVILACIPGASAAAPKVADVASKVMDARDSFSEKATKALDAAQKALPYLAAYASAKVISEQSSSFGSGEEANYVGFALLVPIDGSATTRDVEDTSEEEDALEENIDEVSEETQKQEEEQGRLSSCLKRAYEADCGEGRSLYERASVLASLSGTSNPYYSSVDSWSFAVPLARAKAYYRARVAQEAPVNSTTQERVKSFARKTFYTYALEQLEKSIVITQDGTVTTVKLASLPRNTAEMMETRLFTEAIYPLSTDGTTTTLHYSSVCPLCTSVSGYGALSGVDGRGSGAYAKCPECDFSITTLGSVSSATTSIGTGFEYYWRIIVEEAKKYETTRAELEDAQEETEEKTEESIDLIEQALQSLSDTRYNPDPPGRYGCIAIVVDLNSHEVSSAGSSFLSTGATVSPRVAISAAMIGNEESEYGTTIFSDVFESLAASQDSSSSVFSTGTALGKLGSLWGDALQVYVNGVDSLEDGVTSAINKIPGASATPLSSYAKDEIEDALESCGLQPPNLNIPSPVTVNTARVLDASDSTLSILTDLREAYTSFSSEGGPAQQLLRVFKGKLEAIISDGVDFDAISLTQIDGLPSLPIHIEVPATVQSKAQQLLSQVEQSFGSLVSSGRESEVWQ